MSKVISWQLGFVFVGLLVLVPLFIKAQVFDTAVELRGYAWSGYNSSADGIGWISFNCDNPQVEYDDDGNVIANHPGGTCGTSNYSVQINTDFTLSGYAWSSNIGWIKFGGLGNPPAADIDNDSTARINVARDGLEGWARACAVFSSGCSGAVASDDYRGGWDGWISLSEANTGVGPSYGVVVNNAGGLESYAWGDDIIGWVDFDPASSQVTFTQPCSPSPYCSVDQSEVLNVDQWCESVTTVDSCDTGVGEYCVSGACATPAPIVVPTPISVDKVIARSDSIVTIDWEVDEATAHTCQVTDNNGNVLQTVSINNVPPDALTGPATSQPIDREKTVFTLSCMPTGFNFYVDVGSATTTIIADVFET